MPKFSVYVPEALWEQARREMGERSMSQLVQESLQGLGASTSTPPVGGDLRPTPDRKRLEKIKQRYEEQAREVFQRGYELGMALAEELTPEEMADLAEWDFVFGSYDIAEDEEPWDAHPRAWAILRRLAPELIGEDWPRRLGEGAIAGQGAAGALTDVWRYVQGDADDG